MPSVYRTALGKQVDIDRIRLLNEDTAAVGNMRVNARGDSLDRSGQVNQPKDERMMNSKQNKTYNSVRDEPIAENSTTVQTAKSINQNKNDTAELKATIEKLKREIEEKNALLVQQALAGKTLREAVADTPVIEEEIIEQDVTGTLTPTKTDDKPARGGLAAAIQKNMELQSKKTKPKRI